MKFITNYEKLIIHKHQKWLDQETGLKQEKIHQMSNAVTVLDKNIAFLSPESLYIDLRLIKIQENDDRQITLFGINKLVTKVLAEKYLTMNYIETFLNTKPNINASLFGNMFELYIIEKLCSIGEISNLIIFPNLSLKGKIIGKKKTYYYKGKHQDIFNLTINFQAADDDIIYILTSSQTNFPIFDIIIIRIISGERHFIFVSVKAYSLDRKNPAKFVSDVKREMSLFSKETKDKFINYSETLKNDYGNN